MPLIFSHIGGVSFESQLTNPANTGRAVGAENESEYF